MSRLHLFEFEDLSWFPSFIRNFGTDFLQFLSNKTKMFKPILPMLEEALIESKTNTIVDLGSGGGGGLLWLNEELQKNNKNLKIVLTDLYPNTAAFEYSKKQASNIEFINTSIDAKNVPKNLSGFRTLFLSLHHFKPNDAIQILQSAVDNNTGIAIFEGQERSFPSLLAMFFSPLSVLLTTPFIRPFKILRLLFTYIIPIVPLFVWWDGLVSSLRTYSIKEMNDLVNSVKNKEAYNWEIGKVKSGPGIVLYLIGTKK